MVAGIIVQTAFTQDLKTGVKTGGTTTDSKIRIGQDYQGGRVFYLNPADGGGLIAAPADQSTYVQFGCFGEHIEGTSTEKGTGAKNTKILTAACNSLYMAAKTCDTLSLNGYHDWYVPSRDELSLLWEKRDTIGGFVPEWYWSSSEYNTNYGWFVYFPDGRQMYANRFNFIHLRCIRSF